MEGRVEGRRVVNHKGVNFIPEKDSPHPVPGFSVYLEGLRKGEEKEFTLRIPEDNPDRSLAGKECRFLVRLLEVKEERLPEVNDEFAKGLGEGFESLEELRERVRERLLEAAQEEARRRLREEALKEVIKGARVELPPLVVEREVDRLLEEQERALQNRQVDVETYLRNAGKNPQELREELRPRALERLTEAVVLRKLAELEGIQVTPEELDAEAERRTSGRGPLEEPLRRFFATEEGRRSLGDALLTRKTLLRLEEIVTGKGQEAPGGDAEESGKGGASDGD
jgi:trigger factor